MKAPVPEREEARLEALRRYRVLDTDPERSYDDITRLATFIAQMPMAAVSLVDRERQWFKSRVGLAAQETPRDQAFCAHTILKNETLIVEDALLDARFSQSELVTKPPHMRFYAGAPLVTPDGFALGALCVMDSRPNRLSPEQKAGLEALTRLVIEVLELRRASADLATALEDVKTLNGLLPICSFCKRVRNDSGYWERLEAYLEQHTETSLSHGLCPECLNEHYPEVALAAADAVDDVALKRKQLADLLRARRRLLAEAREQADRFDQLWAARKGGLKKRPGAT